jgi:hypothetical protein
MRPLTGGPAGDGDEGASHLVPRTVEVLPGVRLAEPSHR